MEMTHTAAKWSDSKLNLSDTILGLRGSFVSVSDSIVLGIEKGGDSSGIIVKGKSRKAQLEEAHRTPAESESFLNAHKPSQTSQNRVFLRACR